jgi:hypothetical protein
MKGYNRDLIIYSNRIRDKALGALDYNEHEIIPEEWQVYDVKRLKYRLSSWWNAEIIAYTILIILGTVFTLICVCGRIRF